jgi:MOSC domain-containing protein YiiM
MAETSPGVVAGLYLAGGAGEPMQGVPEAQAVAGKGLEGDRYFLRAGTYTDDPKRGCQLTLIALEALLAVEQETGTAVGPAGARRNVVTRGISLNELVGREFRAGDARLRGIRLSEPCRHLAQLSGISLRSLAHRSGLQAEILVSGPIRQGDPILPI